MSYIFAGRCSFPSLIYCLWMAANSAQCSLVPRNFFFCALQGHPALHYSSDSVHAVGSLLQAATALSPITAKPLQFLAINAQGREKLLSPHQTWLLPKGLQYSHFVAFDQKDIHAAEDRSATVHPIPCLTRVPRANKRINPPQPPLLAGCCV